MVDAAVDPTLKYLEIGSMVAMVLFGMSTVQVYMYFTECLSDPKWLKVFVIGMWLLELAHTFLSGYSIVSSTVTYNGSLNITVLHRANALSGLLANTITFCAQVWFAYRLRRLSGQLIFPYFCMFISLVKCVSFYVVVIYEIVVTDANGIWSQLLLIPSILACAGDLLIAGGLIWCLWTRHQERIFRRTPADKILVWCLETNLLTCVSTSFTFIFFEINKSVKVNYIWIPLSFVTCRLYSMCFFASLIAKKRLENERRVFYVDSELATGDSNGHNMFTELAFPPSRTAGRV